MITLKQQFISQLNPLLLAVEQAALVHNGDLAAKLAIEVLSLCRDYEQAGLSRAEIRDACSNPVAQWPDLVKRVELIRKYEGRL